MSRGTAPSLAALSPSCAKAPRRVRYSRNFSPPKGEEKEMASHHKPSKGQRASCFWGVVPAVHLAMQ